MMKISIIGAGSYGTVLGERLLLNKNNDVTYISSNAEVVDSMNANQTNAAYFPGRNLNSRVKASLDPAAVSYSEVVFLAIPSYAVDKIIGDLDKHLRDDVLLVNLAKGMTLEGGLIHEAFPGYRHSSLKGPTYAIEMLNGLPSALTFGSEKLEDFEFIQHVFKGSGVSLDYSSDIRAVEYLSVLKNVYAIALGIVAGKYNSPNVDFILFTKAVKEMRNYLQCADCDSNTIFNYCGIGDLGLTSLNDLSRNRTLGLLIGKGFLGQNPENSVVVEGLRSVKIFSQKVGKWSISDRFPVLLSLNALLEGEISLSDFISSAVQ